MGTRNLTMAVIHGKFKVAQYGQWDGYPRGQGEIVLHFLRKMNRAAFIANLEHCRFIENDEMQRLYKEAGVKDGSEWISAEESKKFKEKNPQLDRDIGARILEHIAKGGDDIMLQDEHQFASSSLFCEWAYLIDFDKNVLEVYKGFNKRKLAKTARFAGLEPDKDKNGEVKYWQIRLAKKWDLDNLPSDHDFFWALDPEEEKRREEQLQKAKK